MTQRLFYLEQAEKCAAAAKASELRDQRAKFLAAEKSWRRLAELPTAMSVVRASPVHTQTRKSPPKRG